MPEANSECSLAPGVPTTPNFAGQTVLWWSRSGRDYSRDRIVRHAFRELGWKIEDFQPTLSQTANLEATVRRISRPELVWVPCFRQRDVLAAQKWAKKHKTPIVFDPLISCWDKEVFERRKFGESSFRARRLLKIESLMLRQSDMIVADTDAHAEMFSQAHRVQASRLAIIPVSAEEGLFAEQPAQATPNRPRVLFYGSFIGLQGPQHIAQAARKMPEVDWTFIGSGPLLSECSNIARNLSHVKFLPRVPYSELPKEIGNHDILLGIFGDSAKASRVIPNKVYQSLACGRPVVTRQSRAYPCSTRQQKPIESGITFAEAADPDSIVKVLRKLTELGSDEWHRQGRAARRTYETFFSNARVRTALNHLLQQLSLSDLSQNSNS